MVKFSGMPKDAAKLEDADYLPFIDSSEPNPKRQNQTASMGEFKEFFMKDVNANEAERQKVEAARVEAEKERVEAENKREDQEQGYLAQVIDYYHRTQHNVWDGAYATFNVPEDGHLYMMRSPNLEERMTFRIVNNTNLEVVFNGRLSK